MRSHVGSNFFQRRPQLQRKLHAVFISTLVDGELLRTDNGPAFANDLLKGLANLLGSTNEFTTAYSSEENGIVERANKEVLRHLRALVFETRIKDQWSFKDLPIIQRIFNTQEKSSTGVSPADLVLTNAIHMQTNLYSPTDSAKAIETSTPIREVLDKMIARQSILLKAAQKTQSALDSHHIARLPDQLIRPLYRPDWSKR